MRILLTGANGFLGRHFRKYFEQRKDDVLGLTSKMTVVPVNLDKPFNLMTWNLMGSPDHRTKDILKAFQPDLVIHTAAISSNQHCGDNWSANGVMTHNLLSNLTYHTSMLYISSADVCDPFGAENPVNMYGLSKLIGEKLCKQWHWKQTLLQLIILRPVAFTGRYATHGLVRDIVHKLASSDKELKLLGSYPGTSKPILYVNDVIDISMKLLNSITHCVSHISNTDPISVNEVAHLIMDELKIQKPIKYEGNNWLNDNIPNLDSLYSKTVKNSSEAVRLAAKEIYEEIIK